MINAVKGTCWPSTTITVCHSTGKRSAGLKHCRASGSPGAGAKRAGLPGVMHPPRGHARGRFRNSGSQHPLPLLLPLPRSRHRASRNPLVALRFARRLPNRTLRLGGEWGWERPPSERPIYSPAIRTCASPFATCQGSLPARACGAIHPCGKASNPPGRRVGGRRRLRRHGVLDADEGTEPPLPEAALDLVGPLPDVGEPEGLRRGAGGLFRPRDAGGDHNGAPLRQERTGAGSGGGAPVRPWLPQRRERPGVQKGGIALASSSVYTLGRLALALVA